jgi:hypothetical protein
MRHTQTQQNDMQTGMYVIRAVLTWKITTPARRALYIYVDKTTTLTSRNTMHSNTLTQDTDAAQKIATRRSSRNCDGSGQLGET